ncbi:MAG: KilA-N domain-containing protein, partial [Wohlfahrtiimonas sp.]
MIQENQNLIFKSNNELSLYQRPSDGYVDATRLCKQAGKRINNYLRITETKEYLAELERSTLISADLLVVTKSTGLNEERGTWV